MKKDTSFKYKWFGHGDIGASAIIIFDNLTVITFMSLILQFGYNFPLNVIMTHMIPGTVIGVLLGNLLCLWLAFSLAKKEKKHVTAIPFGLDAPSAIGFAVCILGPAFTYFVNKGINSQDAAIKAWQVGVGCLFITGIVKLIFILFVRQLKNMIPQPALLGAMGGVAIALIGFLPIVSIFKSPSAGLVSLSIVLLTIFGGVKLPFKLSGILVAILLGTLMYYLLIPLGFIGTVPKLSTNFSFLLPVPSFGFYGVFTEVLRFLPVILPFSLLVIFGAMSVTESANCMGENYSIKDLVIIDSIATICSSLFGGVAQTTPYAGFPAYKKMDARSGYLFLNIIVVGIGGIFGFVGMIVSIIPEAAIAPVLLYVAFEIAQQGFIHCDKKHYLVIMFSFFPSIARLLQIKITDGSLIANDKLQDMNFTNLIPTINDHLVIIMLGNGFIITGMLWASLLYFVIEQKWTSGFICSVILATFSYFGIIHSLFISGQLYFPSALPETVKHIPVELATGYLCFGALILLLSQLPANKRRV